MAYIVPIHRPSSVRHALKIRLFDSEEDCLCVAKSNRLEIYVYSPDGLVLEHSRAVYGKVTMLHKHRPASSSTDHLFVGTDRFMYFTLSWNQAESQFKTEKSYVDLCEKSARDSQSGDRCLLDPSGRFMTLELYEGIITVLPVLQKSRRKGDPEVGSLGNPVSARIPELLVKSSAFFYPRKSSDRPRLALLYEDSRENVRVKVRELVSGGGGDPGAVVLNEVENVHYEAESGASHLIPVPAQAYGLLIIGETSITYLDEENNERLVEPLHEATIFVAWERIGPQHYLLADDYGKLYLLFLILQGNVVKGWKLDLLGETSRASTLVYLTDGYLFVGSHQGDSQLIKIKEKTIEVVDELPNIAPILDFTVMDMGSRSSEDQPNEYASGQARIVTCSGAYKDGSLRSVRSGVGMAEKGELGEMGHITELFSVDSAGVGDYTDTLVVSLVDETRVFRFGSDEVIEEVEEYNGLTLSEGTLLAANVLNRRLLQVTTSAVRLSDLESGMLIAEWKSPDGQAITTASANDEAVAISIGGVDLVVLGLERDLEMVAQKTFGSESQIACVMTPSLLSEICVVGFWHNASISVLKLDTLDVLMTETIGKEGVSVPRSVLVTQVLDERPPTLFIATADGNLLTYCLSTRDYSLSERKSVVLGTQQASLKSLPRGNGLYNVFASCEHPSLIHDSEGHLAYSAITAERASCVCAFNSELYPGSIAIATPKDLKIASIDPERMTHVQKLALHETVRRIAYSTSLRAFGLGTIKRTLENGTEIVRSHFKLADEVMFKELDSYPLNQDELVESVIKAELDDGFGAIADRFVVGTAYLEDDRDESIRGRILVFEMTLDRKLKLVAERSVKGVCRALAMVEGKIVAALVKAVVVYSFEYETSSTPFLVKRASYRTSTAPIDIAVNDNFIAVADLMKSVSVIEYKRGINGTEDTLEEIARHFQTSWATAVAQIDDNTYLESDAEGNLMVLNQNINGVTEDDRRRLNITGEMLLGEMVNRIRRINIPMAPHAAVSLRAFLATVEGSIYLFALIEPDKQDLLMRLQTNMAKLVQSPGNVPFNKYRAFKTMVREAEEPFRFVDGELIERFPACSADDQLRVIEGLGVNVEDVRVMVDGLRRLH